MTGEWFLLHVMDQARPLAVLRPVRGQACSSYRLNAKVVMSGSNQCRVSFAMSDFARGGRTEENWAELFNSHPLLAKLGRGEAPSLRRSNLADVRLLERDRSYYDAQRELGLPRVTTGDWRPFAWKGTLYLAHWVAFAFPTERMAISSVDEAGGAVRLEHLLSPLPPAVAEAQYARGQRRTEAERRAAAADPASVREKNWGFAADAERLLVFHALLPCTVVLAFDLRAGALQAGASARVESRACFSGAAAATALATGLDILHHPIHGSGNPVPWDVERGAEHREWLGMLHVKRGDYAHWAVRIDRATRRVTHVSAGPVLKNTDYSNEGFLPSALVVGSFHVVDRDGEDGRERVVRIFYGEGDRFGCWLDVAADAIAWHALGSPDAGSALLSRAPRGAALANRTRAPAGAAAGALAAAAGTPRAVQRLSRTLRLLPR